MKVSIRKLITVIKRFLVIYGILHTFKVTALYLLKRKFLATKFRLKVVRVRIKNANLIILLPLESLDELSMPYFFFKKAADYIFSKHLLPKKGVLDCGAHVGLFTLAVWYFSKKKNLTFICVEPVKSNFLLLKYNLLQIKKMSPQTNIILLRKAITDKDDNLIKIYHFSSVAHTIFNYNNMSNDYEFARTISFQTLFKSFKEIDVIKIDIEGAEKFILTAKIPPNIKTIIIEWHKWSNVPWEMFISYFRRQGFKLLIQTLDKRDLKVAYFIR